MIKNNNQIAEDAKFFIKKEKALLIDKFADSDKYPPANNPFSIFMAGSPGAGKTEFSKELLKLLAKHKNSINIVRIDADEIKEFIPQYNGKNSDIVQGAASLGVEKIYDHALKFKQNVIVDGTFANYKVVHENIRRSLDKNRRVGIFYIYQNPLIAWDFTKKREKLEGRHIPKEAFIEAFFKARENVNAMKEEFGKNIEINLVIKDFSNSTEEIRFDITDVDGFIRMSYNKKSLSEILC